jgi:hypothetical protein
MSAGALDASFRERCCSTRRHMPIINSVCFVFQAVDARVAKFHESFCG